MSSVVVLYSGGLDSSTLLYYANSLSLKPYPIFVSYGQVHIKELNSAKAICEKLGTELKVVSLDILQDILPSSLTGKGEVPEGYYKEESMASTVVPGRNLILIAIATGYAKGLGIPTVAYAAHSGDHFIYPDCRLEFVKELGKATKVGYDTGLLSPFISMSKKEIVELGLTLNVPYELTWSCYKGGDRPCLKCGTCTERIEAFLQAGVKDPGLTSEEWKVAVNYLSKGDINA